MQQKFCSYYTTLPQVVGYLNFFKKKTQKYHASQDGVVFKIFEKILRKVPRKTKWSGIIRTKILSLLRVPRKTKQSGTKKSEKVWYLCNFSKKYGSFGFFWQKVGQKKKIPITFQYEKQARRMLCILSTTYQNLECHILCFRFVGHIRKQY